MAQKNLAEMYLDELKDLYDAEKQLTKALPKMAKGASSDELREAFESHLEETKGHVERLEQIFKQLDKPARGKKCKAMEGLVEEGSDLLEEDATSPAMDAGLICAAQKVEHYEIASYGTLIAWSEILGYSDAVSLLEETLQEEKAADEKLTEIASEIDHEATEDEEEEETEEESEVAE